MITGICQSLEAVALLAGLAGLAGGGAARVGGFPPAGAPVSRPPGRRFPARRGAARDLRSHPGMARAGPEPGRR